MTKIHINLTDLSEIKKRAKAKKLQTLKLPSSCG